MNDSNINNVSVDNRPKEIMFAYNNINNVFDAVKRAADRIGIKVLNEDINTFTVELEGKGGIFSKGDPITINLEKVKDLQTKIYFDDHSKKGTLASKNETVEKMKLMINQLLPKMKMPEESNETNNMVNDYNQTPIGNDNEQAAYSNQQIDNYNNQYNNPVPNYQNGEVPNQVMYQDTNMTGYNNQDVSNQQVNNYNNQYNNPVPDYQNGEVPNQVMYQDTNMTGYNNQDVSNQQMDNYNNQYNNPIPNYQNGEVPNQVMYQDTNMAGYNDQDISNQQVNNQQNVMDPVNDLMMGNYGGSETKTITSAPAQSSAKQNSDPLLDFMNNMNV